MSGRGKIKAVTDQRRFTIVYNDFLESDLLNKHEKLIFIALKRFADNDTLMAYPSLNTLHKMTGISVRWIKESLSHMQELGVLRVDARESEKSGHQSNLYTLYDEAEIWRVSTRSDIEQVKEEINLARIKAEARQRGYELVPIKKEPASVLSPVSDASHNVTNETLHNVSTSDGTTLHKGCQERYTMDDIHALYEYDILVHDHSDLQSDIDAVMEILYDVLNTSKDTIRVAGQDRPAMVVIGKLMKLGCDEILYSIRKYSAVTERINNPSAYMLSILYSSKEQMRLDIQNQVQHDLYGNDGGAD